MCVCVGGGGVIPKSLWTADMIGKLIGEVRLQRVKHNGYMCTIGSHFSKLFYI